MITRTKPKTNMFNSTTQKRFILIGIIVLITFSGIFFKNYNPPENKNEVSVQIPKDDVSLIPLIPSIPTVEESTEPTKDVTILVYHSIAPAPIDRTESLMQKRFRIDPENFRSQMQYLKDNDYTPITFLHLTEYLLYNKKIPEKPIVITFDDGLLNQYENAFPVLKEFDFLATFFIYPGITAHRNFMNWEQLKEIVASGNEIGSHTIIHYDLTKIDDEILQNELTKSKRVLEEKLGINVYTIAYPNYAENENVQNAVRDAGYIGARAGWRLIKNSKEEIFHLKAQEASNTKNLFIIP